MIRSERGGCKPAFFRGTSLDAEVKRNETDAQLSRLSATLRGDLQGGGRFCEALSRTPPM